MKIDEVELIFEPDEGGKFLAVGDALIEKELIKIIADELEKLR